MSATERQSASAAPRIPWVTYLLLAVLVATFELAAWSTRGLEEASDSGLEEAVAYLEQHPYLDAAPVLTRLLGIPVEKQRLRFEAELERRGAPPIPDGVQRRQQQTLDELVEAAVAAEARSPAWRWGLVPETPRPSSLLSHVFLHAGWVHLLGNLLLLLVLGVFLEGAWGSVLFAGFVALGAVASGGASSISARELDLPLIGASGLVATLLGAFAVRFARRSDTSYALVLMIGLAWLGLTAWLAPHWSLAAAPDGADHALAARACAAMLIGGAAFGVIGSAFLSLIWHEDSGFEALRGGSATHHSNSRLEKALDAQASGRSQEAFEMLSRAFEEDAASPDVALALWDVALSLGRSADAAPAMLRVLRDDVRRDDRPAVVDHWLELDECGLSVDADSTLLMRVAAILRQEDHPAAALGALQLALSEADRSDSPIVASRVARAAKDLDPDIAEQAAWRALGSVDLSFAERQGLEEMLGELYRTRDIDPRKVGRARSYGQQGSPARLAPVVPVETMPVAGERSERPQPIDLDVGERPLELSVVTPIGLEEEGLRVELADGQKRLLQFRSIDAVAVAAVQGLAAKPVILIDLVLNWMSLRHEPLKVVRLRGDRFDPHRLSAGHSSAVEALRGFLRVLIERTGATPLPDSNSALGHPFAVLDDLASYQRDVLMADGDPVV